jgi:hypothetical protein
MLCLREVLHELPQHLLRLRHLLLLISKLKLLHGRLRELGVLRRGVSCLLPQLVRVGLLPWLSKSLLLFIVLPLAVSRLGTLGVLRRGVVPRLPRLVRVWLLPWLHHQLMWEWLLWCAILRLAVRRLGLLLLAVWNFSIQLLQVENAERVAVYKALPDGTYGKIDVLGEAVSKGLVLLFCFCKNN